MSSLAYRWARQLIADGQVPTTASCLALRELSWCANNLGVCEPSRAELARSTGLSVRGVDKALSALKRIGLVQIHRRKDKFGRDLSSQFQLNLETVVHPQSALQGELHSPPGGSTEYPPLEKKYSLSTGGRVKNRRSGMHPTKSHLVDPITGVRFQPDNDRDQSALLEIKQFSTQEISAAVQAAAAVDDQSRAFPSATLRILKLGRSKRAAEPPAWAATVGCSVDHSVTFEGEYQEEVLS